MTCISKDGGPTHLSYMENDHDIFLLFHNVHGSDITNHRCHRNKYQATDNTTRHEKSPDILLKRKKKS